MSKKYYRSRTCKKCVHYEEYWKTLYYTDINPPDECTYCRRFYDDLFEKKGTESS